MRKASSTPSSVAAVPGGLLCKPNVVLVVGSCHKGWGGAPLCVWRRTRRAFKSFVVSSSSLVYLAAAVNTLFKLSAFGVLRSCYDDVLTCGAVSFVTCMRDVPLIPVPCEH